MRAERRIGRSRIKSGDNEQSMPDLIRRKRRKKGEKKGERKAAELWGFAAWYVRDGVGFNESLVPGLGFSAKLTGEYLSDLPIL